MPYRQENRFVQRLARNAFALVARRLGRAVRVKEKAGPHDVVSDLDFALDRLVAGRLRRAFPEDAVVSEESSPDFDRALKSGKRVWVIDPLCGSGNAARGIMLFCTNIALIENEKVSAGWVFDYVLRRVIWSMGGDKAYVGSKGVPRLPVTGAAPSIDIDWGSLYSLKRGGALRWRYTGFAQDVIAEGKEDVVTWRTSLAFAYVATGQLQGVVSVMIQPWDLLASCFLVEQNGGVVTNFDGSRWSIHSRSVVMADTRKLHGRLLRILKKHRLENVT